MQSKDFTAPPLFGLRERNWYDGTAYAVVRDTTAASPVVAASDSSRSTTATAPGATLLTIEPMLPISEIEEAHRAQLMKDGCGGDVVDYTRSRRESTVDVATLSSQQSAEPQQPVQQDEKKSEEEKEEKEENDESCQQKQEERSETPHTDTEAQQQEDEPHQQEHTEEHDKELETAQLDQHDAGRLEEENKKDQQKEQEVAIIMSEAELEAQRKTLSRRQRKQRAAYLHGPSLVAPSFPLSKMDFLPRAALRLPRLSILDLSNCRLVDLGTGSAWRFIASTLRVLYLHDNRLTRFVFIESVLSELYNLQHLTLAGNHIKPPNPLQLSLRQQLAQTYLGLLVLDEHFILDGERLSFVAPRRSAAPFAEERNNNNHSSSSGSLGFSLKKRDLLYVPFAPHTHIGFDRTSYTLRKSIIAEQQQRHAAAVMNRNRVVLSSAASSGSGGGGGGGAGAGAGAAAAGSRARPSSATSTSQLGGTGYLSLAATATTEDAFQPFTPTTPNDDNSNSAAGRFLSSPVDSPADAAATMINQHTTLESLVLWEWKHLRTLPLRAVALSPAAVIQKAWRRYWARKKYLAAKLLRRQRSKKKKPQQQQGDQVDEPVDPEEESARLIRQEHAHRALQVLRRFIMTYVRFRRGMRKVIERRLMLASSPSLDDGSDGSDHHHHHHHNHLQRRPFLFLDQLQLRRWARWLEHCQGRLAGTAADEEEEQSLTLSASRANEIKDDDRHNNQQQQHEDTQPEQQQEQQQEFDSNDNQPDKKREQEESQQHSPSSSSPSPPLVTVPVAPWFACWPSWHTPANDRRDVDTYDLERSCVFASFTERRFLFRVDAATTTTRTIQQTKRTTTSSFSGGRGRQQQQQQNRKTPQQEDSSSSAGGGAMRPCSQSRYCKFVDRIIISLPCTQEEAAWMRNFGVVDEAALSKRRRGDIFQGLVLSDARRNSLATMMQGASAAATSSSSPFTQESARRKRIERRQKTKHDDDDDDDDNDSSSSSSSSDDDEDADEDNFSRQAKNFQSKLLRVRQRNFVPFPLRCVQFSDEKHCATFLLRLLSLNRQRPRSQVHFFFEDDLIRLNATIVIQAWWRGTWTRLRFLSWQFRSGGPTSVWSYRIARRLRVGPRLVYFSCCQIQNWWRTVLARRRYRFLSTLHTLIQGHTHGQSACLHVGANTIAALLRDVYSGVHSVMAMSASGMFSLMSGGNNNASSGLLSGSSVGQQQQQQQAQLPPLTNNSLVSASSFIPVASQCGSSGVWTPRTPALQPSATQTQLYEADLEQLAFKLDSAKASFAARLLPELASVQTDALSALAFCLRNTAQRLKDARKTEELIKTQGTSTGWNWSLSLDDDDEEEQQRKRRNKMRQVNVLLPMCVRCKYVSPEAFYAGIDIPRDVVSFLNQNIIESEPSPEATTFLMQLSAAATLLHGMELTQFYTGEFNADLGAVSCRVATFEQCPPLASNKQAISPKRSAMSALRKAMGAFAGTFKNVRSKAQQNNNADGGDADRTNNNNQQQQGTRQNLADEVISPDKKCVHAMAPGEGSFLKRIEWLLQLAEKHPNGYLALSASTSNDALGRFLLIASLTWKLPLGQMLCPEPAGRLKLRAAVRVIEAWWKGRVVGSARVRDDTTTTRSRSGGGGGGVHIRRLSSSLTRRGGGGGASTATGSFQLMRPASSAPTSGRGSRMFRPTTSPPSSVQQSVTPTSQQRQQQQQTDNNTNVQQQQQPTTTASQIPALRSDSVMSGDSNPSPAPRRSGGGSPPGNNNNNNNTASEKRRSPYRLATILSTDKPTKTSDGFILRPVQKVREMHAPFISRNIANKSFNRRPTANPKFNKKQQQHDDDRDNDEHDNDNDDATRYYSSSVLRTNTGDKPPISSSSSSARANKQGAVAGGKIEIETYGYKFNDGPTSDIWANLSWRAGIHRSMSASAIRSKLSTTTTTTNKKSTSAVAATSSTSTQKQQQKSGGGGDGERASSTASNSRKSTSSQRAAAASGDDVRDDKDATETVVAPKQGEDDGHGQLPVLKQDDDDDDNSDDGDDISEVSSPDVFPFEPNDEIILPDSDGDKKQQQQQSKTTTSRPSSSGKDRRDDDRDEGEGSTAHEQKNVSALDDGDADDEVMMMTSSSSSSTQRKYQTQRRPPFAQLGIAAVDSVVRNAFTVQSGGKHAAPLFVRRPPSGKGTSAPDGENNVLHLKQLRLFSGDDDDDDDVRREESSSMSSSSCVSVAGSNENNHGEDEDGEHQQKNKENMTSSVRRTKGCQQRHHPHTSAGKHVFGLVSRIPVQDAQRAVMKNNVVAEGNNNRPQSARVFTTSAAMMHPAPPSSALSSSLSRHRRPASARTATNNNNMVSSSSASFCASSFFSPTSARRVEAKPAAAPLASASPINMLDAPNAAHSFHVACLREHSATKSRQVAARDSAYEERKEFVKQQRQAEEAAQKEHVQRSRSASGSRRKLPYPLGSGAPLTPWTVTVPKKKASSNK